jgi:hypothetical protein
MVDQVVIPMLGEAQLVVVIYPFSDQNEDEYWEHLDDPYGDRESQRRTRSRG